MTKTNPQRIAKAVDSKKPEIETIRNLKGISASFNIEMHIIKSRYNTIIQSTPVQNLDVSNKFERERHAMRILVAELTSEQDSKYNKGVDLYCDFGTELASIRDRVVRTSVQMSNNFGAEYDFSGVLKEIDRVRDLLEKKIDGRFFGGK